MKIKCRKKMWSKIVKHERGKEEFWNGNNNVER